MQRGIADDLSVHQRQQRQVAAQVNVLAPVADGLEFGHPVLDEHAFGFRDGEEELVKALFVVLAERAQLAFGSVLQFDVLRIFLQFEFE